MAKKSAKSKGYRKQQAKKKPYLSKKEIIVLCAVAAAVIVVAIVMACYNDGALKVRNGVVQTGGDNWLIVNGSDTSRARYFKMGEVGDIEGYSLNEVSALTDSNVPTYEFVPDDAESPVSTITITASHYVADELAQSASTMMASFTGYEVGEIQHTEVNGVPVAYYIYTMDYYDEEADAEAAEDSGEAEATEDGEPASNRFTKVLSSYVDGAHDSCVLVLVQCNADSAEDYPADEILIEAMEKAVPTLKLEKK